MQGQVDILDVFRRPQDLPAHLEDMLALKPDVVWLQSGIRWVAELGVRVAVRLGAGGGGLWVHLVA